MTHDSSKLSFDSGFRYERVVLKGSVAFSVGTVFPATTPTYTIAHNLGYKPYVKAWYTYGDGRYFALSAGPSSYNLGGNSIQIDNSYVDTANFYVTFFGFTVAATGTLYYRIYAERQA
jgi:hypothetical protein